MTTTAAAVVMAIQPIARATPPIAPMTANRIPNRMMITSHEYSNSTAIPLVLTNLSAEEHHSRSETSTVHQSNNDRGSRQLRIKCVRHYENRRRRDN